MCGVKRKSLLPYPTQLWGVFFVCRKSDSAGALPIPFTQGLGGSLVQSALLTVISPNPTATLLYYRSRLAFRDHEPFPIRRILSPKARRWQMCPAAELGSDQCLLQRFKKTTKTKQKKGPTVTHSSPEQRLARRSVSFRLSFFFLIRGWVE